MLELYRSQVIFLYLLDNEYTSRIVLFSVGSGTAVEAWKVKRITKGGWVWRYGLPWAVVGAAVPLAQAPQEQLQDGSVNVADVDAGDAAGGGASGGEVAVVAESEGERLTKEIDALGMCAHTYTYTRP